MVVESCAAELGENEIKTNKDHDSMVTPGDIKCRDYEDAESA